MASILPTDTEKIEDMGRELVGALGRDLSEARDVDAIRARVGQMATAVGPLVGTPRRRRRPTAAPTSRGAVLPAVERPTRVSRWPTRPSAARCTARTRRAPPRSNLVLDQVAGGTARGPWANRWPAATPSCTRGCAKRPKSARGTARAARRHTWTATSWAAPLPRWYAATTSTWRTRWSSSRHPASRLRRPHPDPRQ